MIREERQRQAQGLLLYAEYSLHESVESSAPYGLILQRSSVLASVSGTGRSSLLSDFKTVTKNGGHFSRSLFSTK